jgi:hypothetical protein
MGGIKNHPGEGGGGNGKGFFAVSSSHPLANKVFFAKSKISSKGKETVTIYNIKYYLCLKCNLNYFSDYDYGSRSG